jgi:methyl-accepting chemotaxis protein
MGIDRASERRDGALPLGGRLRRLALLLPAVVMCLGFGGLAFYCHRLLDEAAAGRPVRAGDAGFWLAVAGFFLACIAVVLLQSLRLAQRVAGPEWRLRRSLRRIRAGDLGFRITLRRGDLLNGMAHECNELLDWLNANPPPGVRTGSDVVEVGADAGEEVRA